MTKIRLLYMPSIEIDYLASKTVMFWGLPVGTKKVPCTEFPTYQDYCDWLFAFREKDTAVIALVEKHWKERENSEGWAFCDSGVGSVKRSRFRIGTIGLVHHELAHLLTGDYKHCNSFPLTCALSMWNNPFRLFLPVFGLCKKHRGMI